MLGQQKKKPRAQYDGRLAVPPEHFGERRDNRGEWMRTNRIEPDFFRIVSTSWNLTNPGLTRHLLPDTRLSDSIRFA